MHRNGQHPTLRVLLSGAATEDLAETLHEQASLSVTRATDRNGQRAASAADVALHVVSSPGDVAEEINQVRSLSNAPLILAAYGEPNGIAETGLAVGAADVLVLPQPAETLLFALRKAARANSALSDAGKIVTIFSPKGGSGKTVLATNLAIATMRAGTSTLLVDLDLQFGDAALTLAIPPRATIADLAAASGDVDIEKLKAFVSVGPRSPLPLLAAPKRPEEAQMVGQAELGAILDAARRAYSAIVIDTGPLFDGAMLSALDRTDQLLLICNPEVTSLKNARLGLETIDRLGFPRDRISVVVNRSGSVGGVSRREIEEVLEVDVAFELPDDPAVPVAINRATPVVLVDEKSRFARAVVALSSAIFAEAPAPAAALQAKRTLLRGRR